MKMLRFSVAAMLLFGPFSTYASSAAPKVPPQERPKTPASKAAAVAQEEASPEEKTRRRDWALSMHKKPAPKKGCFTASYPGTEWKEVPCAPMRNIPMVPRRGARPFVVGNANDISAGAPSGFISQAIGHFENVTNVNNESGPIGNTGPSIANAYTLQINTNQFTSTVCSGSPNPNCKGWQQFVYENNGTSGNAYIQYWLIKYNAACPAGQSWKKFQFTGDTDIYCWKNNSVGPVGVPNQPITNMANWTFSGAVSSTGDSVAMTVGTTAYKSDRRQCRQCREWLGNRRIQPLRRRRQQRWRRHRQLQRRSLGQHAHRDHLWRYHRAQLRGARFHRRDEQPQLRADRSGSDGAGTGGDLPAEHRWRRNLELRCRLHHR